MKKISEAEISKVMAFLGRKGGSVKSEAKTLACRANAKKPRKPVATPLLTRSHD